MFGWRSRRGRAERAAAIAEVDMHTDLDSLLRGESAVLFKHSAACPVSWAAHAQVIRFLRQRPSSRVHMVPVLKHRPVSMEIARRTGIRHESPQIIVLRNGEVVDSASHGEITAEWLAAVTEGVRT